MLNTIRNGIARSFNMNDPKFYDESSNLRDKFLLAVGYLSRLLFTNSKLIEYKNHQ